jgi:hypothetical protein
MSLVASNKSEQNKAAIDPWTAVHLASGLGAGLMGWPLKPVLAAGVIYEVLEQGIESKPNSIFNVSGPEVLSNVAVDILVLWAGWHLGQRWNAT